MVAKRSRWDSPRVPAPEVRSAVDGWLAFINPKGFTEGACFKGGCTRPFAENSCCGMDAAHVILGDDVQWIRFRIGRPAVIF